MKKMRLSDYHLNMGELIDLSHPDDYVMSGLSYAKNIPYQHFMMYYDKYLNKRKKYYIMCLKGIHSHRACALLEYLGYDVTQVLK